MVDRKGCLHPLEVKATATVLPGHAEALLKWKELAKESAEGGVIVADIDQPFTFKDLKAISWWNGTDSIRGS